MKRLLDWIRTHLLAAFAATGLLSAIGGAVITDFTSWRTTNRDFLKVQAEVSLKADQDLIDIVRKFSNKALGKASTTPDDLKTLQASVAKSFLVASTLKDRLPGLKSDFDQYAEALFDLQKSAEKMTGPADAQSFVEAVSAFANRRQVFLQRIASMQNSWPL
jgi:hypothetical protein